MRLPRLSEAEVRIGVDQLTAGGPKSSGDGRIGHMRADGLASWCATQTQDPRSRQAPSLYLRAEGGTDGGPCSGVLALHQEPGGLGRVAARCGLARAPAGGTG
ncbi:hypothetical protein GCM10010339_84950 [Streptomyces alanosinicus]|uniref:Uncharacterized protein n=1 Tax=Streptomyces alanosinicus TaxID=68171 RepID=A0A918YRW9_9ACTN|nr:hypothetical protein GCM10010339_84950 [Streptomyces alanosinicus]